MIPVYNNLIISKTTSSNGFMRFLAIQIQTQTKGIQLYHHILAEQQLALENKANSIAMQKWDKVITQAFIITV